MGIYHTINRTRPDGLTTRQLIDRQQTADAYLTARLPRGYTEYHIAERCHYWLAATSEIFVRDWNADDEDPPAELLDQVDTITLMCGMKTLTKNLRRALRRLEERRPAVA